MDMLLLLLLVKERTEYIRSLFMFIRMLVFFILFYDLSRCHTRQHNKLYVKKNWPHECINTFYGCCTSFSLTFSVKSPSYKKRKGLSHGEESFSSQLSMNLSSVSRPFQ